MTPKETAQELYSKLLRRVKNLSVAKHCALLAVEFARGEFDNHCCAEINTKGTPQEHFDSIKQEIEKL